MVRYKSGRHSCGGHCLWELFFFPTAVHQGPCLSFKLCCKPILLTQQTWFCFLNYFDVFHQAKFQNEYSDLKLHILRFYFFRYPLITKFKISYFHGYIYSIFMRRLILEFLCKRFVINHVSIFFFSVVLFTIDFCLSAWYWAMCASSYVPERNLYKEWSKECNSFWSKFQHKHLSSRCYKIFITLLPCFLGSSDDLLFFCYRVDCNMLWYFPFFWAFPFLK